MKQALSKRFRSQRAALLRQVLDNCPRQGDRLRILDVGGRAGYWREVGLDHLRGIGAQITLLNMSADETEAHSNGADGLFTAAVGNGCALNYPDGQFDLCHSNSVIEHVGRWGEMAAFARETRRVAASYYVQTPNYAFPIDPHFWRMPFFHWLPRPVRAALVRHFPLASGGRAGDLGKAYTMVDSSRLLTRGQMRFLFPEATIHAERVLGFAKSLAAVALRDNPPDRTAESD